MKQSSKVPFLYTSALILSALQLSACGSQGHDGPTYSRIKTPPTTSQPAEASKSDAQPPLVVPPRDESQKDQSKKPVTTKTEPSIPPVVPAKPPRPVPLAAPKVEPKAPVDSTSGTVGTSIDFPTSEGYKDSTYGQIMPIIKTSSYTFWATSWADRSGSLEHTQGALKIVRAERGVIPNKDSKSISVGTISGGTGSWVWHAIRRGVELSDGSLLFIGLDGLNVEGSYKFGYILKTDSDLNIDKSFGKNGAFALSSTKTIYNDRLIVKVVEKPKGELLLTEKRYVIEGQGQLTESAPKCYEIMLTAKGQLKKSFGKGGIKDLGGCN